MVFPEYRPRRLRKNESLRALIRETQLSPAQFVYPVFIAPGKNKREEISSMPGVFRLSVDQLAKEAEQALFVSKRGGRLARRSVEKRLKEWAIRQGISRNIHPHMLRHSFASHMLESSGDLRAVQELLGHQNISTTQIYTHLDFQHLAKVFDKAHPRAKRKKD